MTLKQHIEVWAGAVSSDLAGTALTAAVRHLINLLPEPRAAVMGTHIALTGTTSVNAYRILSVYLGERIARYVTPKVFAKTADEKSIHYAFQEDPVYTIKADRIVMPDAYDTDRSLDVVAYPADVDEGGDTITGFPSELQLAAVLYAAMEALAEKLQKVSTVKLEGLVVPTLTVATPVPDFTPYAVMAADAIAILHALVGNLPEAPALSYTPGTAPVPDFSGIVVPTFPTLPAVAYFDAATPALAAVEALPDVSALLTAARGYLDTDQDIELALAKFKDIETQISQWQLHAQLALQQDIASAQQEGETNRQNAVQRAATELKTVDSLLSTFTTQMQGYRTRIEGASAENQAQLAAYTQEAQLKLQAALATFQMQAERVRLQVEMLIKEADYQQQAAVAQVQLAQDVHAKEEQLKLEAALKNFSGALENYQTKLAYAKAQAEVAYQGNQTLVAAAAQEAQVYAKQMEVAQAAFQRELALYLGTKEQANGSRG